MPKLPINIVGIQKTCEILRYLDNAGNYVSQDDLFRDFKDLSNKQLEEMYSVGFVEREDKEGKIFYKISDSVKALVHFPFRIR